MTKEKNININNETASDEKKYSLNDDRRVKVLSPGALVAKRFFRNRLAVTGMAILIFMFVFSFIGGIVSPYDQDQLFYRDDEMRKDFAAVMLNEEYRYATVDKDTFGSASQAQAMLAIIKGNKSFDYDGKSYSLKKEGEDFYTVLVGDSVVGICFKDMVNSTSGNDSFSFEFKYAALKAFADKKKSFEAEGKSYKMDESGTVLSNGKEIAYVSRYIVNPIMPDIVLNRDFKDKLIATIESGGEKFTYTDETLISEDSAENEAGSEGDSGDTSAAADSGIMQGAESGSEGLATDDGVADENLNTQSSATAEYDIEYDASKKIWNILQSQSTRKYDTYAEPSGTHWLGTDRNGMDMMTRLMYGGRVSLMIGFIVILIETFIGVVLGGIAGYFGGWLDNIIMRIVDIFYCIPSMPIIIILGAAMDAARLDSMVRMVYLMLILGILGWAGVARLVRGQILSLREQEFMTATEACGIKVSSRIFKHLIPNVIPQLIVYCTMGLGDVIITEATLSFLGLGVRFPFASWGNIINDVNNTFVLTTYWFIWIPAGVLLLLTVLAFNLVGDGLRDAFDPKMKR